jgi:hypothetical protein
MYGGGHERVVLPRELMPLVAAIAWLSTQPSTP